MSIATFADLRTQIASWLNRTDLTTAQLSQFVAATEDDIRNDLEVRDSEQRATGTMNGDGFTAPTGFLVCRTLVVGGEFLEYLSPELYAKLVQSGSTLKYYTINGDVFSVNGGDGADFELLYQATITSLSADGDSNWVLANASNVYLWGGCKYGSVFLRDVAAAGGYASLYDRAVTMLNRVEREARHGGPLTVRPA